MNNEENIKEEKQNAEPEFEEIPGFGASEEKAQEKKSRRKGGKKGAAKGKKGKKKDFLSIIIVVLLMTVGAGIMLYPSFSNWWNTAHQSRVISSYEDKAASIDPTMYEEYLKQAQTYNNWIRLKGNVFQMTDERAERYNSLLNINGDGMMGYIEIPKIKVKLPIYHGTGESVLQVAIGHVEWSSLPVGGENTHAVLSGHRGLPSAKLFTNLDKMEIGDAFYIHVLNYTLEYEVDQILTVLPEETDALRIVDGEDYVTLVTCTPYGINTHRLLVRGKRVQKAETSTKTTLS